MFQCGAYSSSGRKPENQDYYLLSSCHRNHPEPDNKAFLALLADGVSSCKKPKQASQLAIQSFYQQFAESAQLPLTEGRSNSIETLLSEAIQQANDALYFSSGQERGPALLSTLTGAVFTTNHMHVINVGDSRCYRYFENKLEQLSQDDSVNSGRYKGALNRALGADSRIQAQYKSLPLIAGELYFLATDGVYEHITPTELKTLLKQATQSPKNNNESHLNAIAQAIGQAAYDNGSRDNISCLIVKVANTSSNYSQRQGKRFPPPLKAGDKLDNFTVLAELHASPRSQIYLAQEQESGEHRIIKTPSEYFNDDPVYIRRFFKEEKIGLRFDHQSIIKFFPKPLSSQYIYHVTEFIEGQTLSQYIKDHAPLSPRVTHELVKKIALSLRVLHRAHLLHQDLKPDNIMLTKDGDIKIIDLGSVGSSILKDNNNTPPGALSHTAPEYFQGKSIGEHSDLFSVAVIAYEMLTGKLPFGSQTITPATKSLDYKPIAKRNPNAPNWLDPVFEQALHIESRARFQSLSDFILALDPNKHKQSDRSEPLMRRNPLLAWKGISVVLLIINLVLLWKLLS